MRLILNLATVFALLTGSASLPALPQSSAGQDPQPPAAGASQGRPQGQSTGAAERAFDQDARNARRATRQMRRGTSLFAFYVQLADSSGDGALSKSEIAALEKTLGADAQGQLDRGRVLAKLLLGSFDANRDGRSDGKDLVALFDAVDANPDGQLSAEELRGRGRSRIASIAMLGADANGDGVISGEEWSTHVKAAVDSDTGALRLDVVQSWIRAAIDDVSEASRRQVTAGVALLTLESQLDVDKNGRLDFADVQQVLLARDTNQDGELSAEEIRTRPQRNTRRTSRDPRPPLRKDAPPLMPFQRSLEDALALSKQTGQPMLICVNMDGEAASERLAWAYYRDADFAELAKGFVCVIASPDRRNDFDYDDRGRRIEDRRFGRVTNGEHISIEPELFQRYFGGRRVAPRHMGIAPDGSILFDIFLVNDFTVLYDAMQKHGKPDAAVPPAEKLSLRQLLRSPDAGHRAELERRALDGRLEEQVELARSAISNVRRVQHPDLLRISLRSTDYEVREAAVISATKALDRVPPELLPQLYFVASEFAGRARVLRDALLRAYGRVGAGKLSEQLAKIAPAAEALALRSGAIQADRWRAGLAVLPMQQERDLQSESLEALQVRTEELRREHESKPRDRSLALLTMRASLRYARALLANHQRANAALDRVLQIGDGLQRPGEADHEALALRAWALDLFGDSDAALHEALRALPYGVASPTAPESAHLLAILLRERSTRIAEAMTLAAGMQDSQPQPSRATWPSSWLSQAHDAAEILRWHGSGTPAQVLQHLQLLERLGMNHAQHRALREALRRWPNTGELHNWYRALVLRNRGARAMDGAYAEIEVDASARAAFTWYHGYAVYVAAEHQVKTRRYQAAETSYERSAMLFASAMEQNPGFANSSKHYLTLVLSGQAALLQRNEQWAVAHELMMRALREAPSSVDTQSGLAKTPRQLARELQQALRAARRFELAESLNEALGQLPAAQEGGR